jgi:purine-nucleoside phosphorylase
MVRAIGGTLVGMSTTLEAIAAREAGMEVLGISLVTNLAAGITGEPLNHEEVLEAGRSAATRMGELLGSIVPRI